MSLSSLSSLLQRLLSDDGLRRTFVDSPDAVLSNQPLSSEERRALLRMRSRLIAAGSPSEMPFRILVPWWP